MKLTVISTLILLAPLVGCTSLSTPNSYVNNQVAPASSAMQSTSNLLAKSDSSTFSIPLYTTELENMSFSFQLLGNSDFLH
jgi:hypothetical protein